MNLKTLALATAVSLATMSGAHAALPTTVTSYAIPADWATALSAFNTWSNAWTSFFTTAGTFNWDFEAFQSSRFNIIAGNFTSVGYDTLQFTYFGTTASYSLPAVAVPGPEAGAGIGALAMGGMAYLLHRRRKESVAA
jgi:MYXO-CTERM domain-containing protein